MAHYAADRRPRHAGDLHARRGGRDPRAGAGPARRRRGRPARRLPDRRAGRRLRRAGRHRPPVPRRRRPLPRLGDDGPAPPTSTPGRSGRPTSTRPPGTWWRSCGRSARRSLVTYDPNGFYGHPDHIQAHRVAMRAVELAAAEGVAPAKVYWTAMPRSVLEAGLSHFAESLGQPVRRHRERRRPALRHPGRRRSPPGSTAPTSTPPRRRRCGRTPPRSRPPRGSTRSPATSAREFMGVEYFTLAVGEKGPGTGPYGWEDDLFAGLALDGAGPVPGRGGRPPVTLPAAPMSVVPEQEPAAPPRAAAAGARPRAAGGRRRDRRGSAGCSPRCWSCCCPPFRVGGQLIGVSVLVAIGANIVLSWFAHEAVGTPLGGGAAGGAVVRADGGRRRSGPPRATCCSPATTGSAWR